MSCCVLRLGLFRLTNETENTNASLILFLLLFVLSCAREWSNNNKQDAPFRLIHETERPLRLIGETE